MQITGLSHIGLSTRDLDAAVTFYADAFGFAEITRFGWDAGNDAADAGLGLSSTAATIVVMSAGNAYLEILEFDTPAPIALDDPPTLFREGITHLALHTDDLAAATSAVISAGGSLASPATRTTTQLVRDPEGNLIELYASTDAGPGSYHALDVQVPHADAGTFTNRPQPRRDLVRGVHHVGVCTLDTEATAAFYRSGGLTTVSDHRWDLTGTATVAASHMVALRGRAHLMSFGNAFLELLEYADAPVQARPPSARIIEYGFNHFCVDVDDIGAVHRHLTRAGMTSHAAWVDMPGGNAAMGYALDVQRTPVELLEHRTSSSTMWPGHLSI